MPLPCSGSEAAGTAGSWNVIGLGGLTGIPGATGCLANGLLSMNFGLSLVFQLRHFRQTAAMTLGTAKPRGQKCLNQFPGECVTHYETPEADHVQSVVLDALVSRKGLMNQ